MLKGKNILLGVTGSIAAYKIANLASMLVKLGADVHVIMTKNATQFITPVTFETLTKNRCYTDTFERTYPVEVSHIALAQRADAVLVAPAMNVHMFESAPVQENLAALQRRGVTVIPPDEGYLACGDTGKGKLPSEQTLCDYLLRELAREKD